MSELLCPMPGKWDIGVIPWGLPSTPDRLMGQDSPNDFKGSSDWDTAQKTEPRP